jgi:hypothetical protein
MGEPFSEYFSLAFYILAEEFFGFNDYLDFFARYRKVSKGSGVLAMNGFTSFTALRAYRALCGRMSADD